MRSMLFVLLIISTGCEKDLLADVHDAGPDAEQIIDAQTHCTAPTTDAHPAAKHALFLTFDGVMLSSCSQASSKSNCTDLVPGDTMFPPFLDGKPARDSYIASIVNLAWKGLAPYSIDIVTTRPASGDYYMIVIGGTPALVGAPSNYATLTPHHCIADNDNLIDVIFDQGQAWTQHDYANTVLSDFGMMVGLPATTGPMNDCACRNCPFNSSLLCTFGSNSPVTTDPAHSCGLTTADEPALLTASLGCR